MAITHLSLRWKEIQLLVEDVKWKIFKAKYDDIQVRKMYQLDAHNFIMILSHKWPLHVSDIYMSIFRSSYM